MESESKQDKVLVRFLGSRYWTALILVLVAIIFFFLGRISRVEETREPVKVLERGPIEQAASPVVAAGDNRVVASKNSTKYHYPWCSGAQRISAANLRTFNSPEEARAAGLTPASNCKGLK